MPDTKYFKKLTIGDQEYYVKDEYARQQIESLATYTKFLGVTTTNIVNGTTSAIVSIDGTDVTAKTGDIVIKDAKEFIYNGTAWAEFGDLDALQNLLGDFAYVDEGTVTVNEYGNPTWEGTQVHLDFVGNSFNSTGTATVEGTVSKPNVDVDDSNTGTVGISKGTLPSLKNGENNGTAYQVDVDEINENLTFTALTFNAGTKQELTGTTTFITGVTAELASAPIFTQTSGNVSVSGTATGAIKVGDELTATGNYTPDGSITQGTATGVAKTVSPVAKSGS